MYMYSYKAKGKTKYKFMYIWWLYFSSGNDPVSITEIGFTPGLPKDKLEQNLLIFIFKLSAINDDFRSKVVMIQGNNKLNGKYYLFELTATFTRRKTLL